MVAAYTTLQQTEHEPIGGAHAFVGDWQLDRVSGLLDAMGDMWQHVRIDACTLQLTMTLAGRGEPLTLTAELNGESVEATVGDHRYCAQALLEGGVLVWEVERQTPLGCERVRRVMHPSKQGSQLIAERVALNPAGAPVALCTEYWIRAHLAPPRETHSR